MNANKTRSVWALDPRWTRIEHFDKDGQSLGVVRFEPRQLRLVARPNFPPVLWHRAIQLACAAVGLMAGLGTLATLLMAGW
jgi:hypothetical protein